MSQEILLEIRCPGSCGANVGGLVRDDGKLRLVLKDRKPRRARSKIALVSRWTEDPIIRHPAEVAAAGLSEDSWIVAWACPQCRAQLEVRPLAAPFLAKLSDAEERGVTNSITAVPAESG